MTESDEIDFGDYRKVEELKAVAIKEPSELMNVEQPEEPVDLEELFFKLKATVYEIQDRERFIVETIKTLEAKREELVKDLENEKETLENAIKTEIFKQSKSFKCFHGSASYRKAYDRTSWDSKKLDGLALVIPQIQECKTVTKVDASVSLKVGYQA